MATATFHSKSTALDVVHSLNVNLDGQIVIVTGGTSGIGIETVRALASTHAHVIITTRDLTKGKQAVEDMKKSTGNKSIEAIECDLTSLESVRSFISEFRTRQLPIKILICNAETKACPYSKTTDGFESQFAVNHLAHFFLTTNLLPELEAGKPSRVIIVSSVANKRGGINWYDINWDKKYDKWLAYSQSKTANILFAKQLDKLYASKGIHAYSVHPGGIITNLRQNIPEKEQRAMGWYKDDGTLIEVFKTAAQAASTSVYGALAPELDHFGGEHLEDCAVSKGVNPDKTAWGIAPHAADMEEAERLWKLSEQMVVSKMHV
ncbi:unnamed protein product [Adineta ricciae]|uniref:Uncharacterized protein n=1 Tax=Adineta ricciae TaxID=249248 RepID=A0A815F890_ADIRI|nr:unnamed protein product [Adineta ricciae]CAF1413051.1 unnamed protein product [Adineta ricciae]